MRKLDKYGYIREKCHNEFKPILINCRDLYSVEYHKKYMIYRIAITPANDWTDSDLMPLILFISSKLSRRSHEKITTCRIEFALQRYSVDHESAEFS